jgi:signal transduction histidine kinase
MPASISAVFLLALSLWMAYALMGSITSQRIVRTEFAKQRARLLQNAVVESQSNKITSKKIEELASELFSTLESEHTKILLYLYIIGCVAILLFFLTWYYNIRMEEFSKRCDEAKSRREEVDELGLAAIGLAHETKNPLGVIRGLAQNIADDAANSEKTRKKARNIMEETDVTTARLGDFLSYAKFRSPSPEPIDARAHLERIASLVTDEFASAGVSLNTNISQLVIEADQDMLSQVVMNLLTNSLKFTKPGGSVSLSLETEETGFAILRVSDTGAGIPPDVLPEVFKPYVTKRTGGYGIGLAIVKRIADQAGWSIEIDSKEGEGTTVTLKNVPLA